MTILWPPFVGWMFFCSLLFRILSRTRVRIDKRTGSCHGQQGTEETVEYRERRAEHSFLAERRPLGLRHSARIPYSRIFNLRQKAILSIGDSALSGKEDLKRRGLLDAVEKNIRERKKKESATPAVQVPSDVLHPELYDRLVAWRNSEASRLGLPVYTVIQQKAILGISNLLPADKAMLVRIPYFGKKGVEKYGDIILEMVHGYRKEKGLAEPELML